MVIHSNFERVSREIMSVMGSEVNRLLKKIKDGDLTKREELFKITAICSA